MSKKSDKKTKSKKTSITFSEVKEKKVRVKREPSDKPREPKKLTMPKEPKNVGQLKRYISTYFKAMRWDKPFTFEGTNFHIKDFKIVSDKENCSVTVTMKASFITGKDMLTKSLKATYTLDNYETVKSDIRRVYNDIERQKYFIGDKLDVEKIVKDDILHKGWFPVYSVALHDKGII